MFAEDRHSQRTGKRGHPIYTARVANHSGAPVHYSAVKVGAESESDALRTWCENGENFQISMEFPWQHGNLNMATDDINHKPWDVMGCHGISWDSWSRGYGHGAHGAHGAHAQHEQ